MAGLWAAVIVLAIVSLLLLTLDVAIIARLRRIAEGLSDMASAGMATLDQGLKPGEGVPSFSATTVSGTEVSQRTIAGGGVVVFLGAECDACRRHIRDFIGNTREVRPREKGILVVVAGDPARGQDLVAAAGTVADVVAEPDGGPLSDLFRVGIFPTLFVIDSSGLVSFVTHSGREARGRAFNLSGTRTGA